MKRIRKKISVYLLAAVVGLGCLPFTVYAQEEIGNNAGSFHVEGGTEGTDWVYEQSTNILTFNAPGDYTVTGDGMETTERIVVADSFGTGSITIENININLGINPSTGSGSIYRCAFTVQNRADLTLNLQGSNTLVSGTHINTDLLFHGTAAHLMACGSAGIEVRGSLTIEGEGSLTVRGGFNAAGIGGNGGHNADTDVGNIFINSGTVNAEGGARGAGIGGGLNAYNHGEIHINGGTVNATGGANAAAIGAGYYNEFGAKVYITGGVVTATSPETGIGSGTNPSVENSSPGRIEITGGTVYAEGSTLSSTGAGIGGGRYSAGYEIEISGGNVYARATPGSARE